MSHNKPLAVLIARHMRALRLRGWRRQARRADVATSGDTQVGRRRHPNSTNDAPCASTRAKRHLFPLLCGSGARRGRHGSMEKGKGGLAAEHVLLTRAPQWPAMRGAHNASRTENHIASPNQELCPNEVGSKTDETTGSSSGASTHPPLPMQPKLIHK